MVCSCVPGRVICGEHSGPLSLHYTEREVDAARSPASRDALLTTSRATPPSGRIPRQTPCLERAGPPHASAGPIPGAPHPPLPSPARVTGGRYHRPDVTLAATRPPYTRHRSPRQTPWRFPLPLRCAHRMLPTCITHRHLPIPNKPATYPPPSCITTPLRFKPTRIRAPDHPLLSAHHAPPLGPNLPTPHIVPATTRTSRLSPPNALSPTPNLPAIIHAATAPDRSVATLASSITSSWCRSDQTRMLRRPPPPGLFTRHRRIAGIPGVQRSTHPSQINMYVGTESGGRRANYGPKCTSRE